MTHQRRHQGERPPRVNWFLQLLGVEAILRWFDHEFDRLETLIEASAADEAAMKRVIAKFKASAVTVDAIEANQERDTNP